jgi:ribonuclease-3
VNGHSLLDTASLLRIQTLQSRLKVTFRDPFLLLRALRHRSMTEMYERTAGERTGVVYAARDCNERLEFLGDSIVGMVVCETLYERFPDASEGTLAKAKAFLVSEPTLAEAGFALGLDEVIEISGAVEIAGGRKRPSILSDAFEAVVAAVSLDRGIRTARRLIRTSLADALRRVAEDEYTHDFKSLLQEHLQAAVRQTPRYRIVEERGADHDKTFLAQAMVLEEVLGEGLGRSKKQAEQAAAQDALEKIRHTNAPAETAPTDAVENQEVISEETSEERPSEP